MSGLNNCKKCNNSFDSTSRKPMLGSCGHSICSACRNELLLNKAHVCERCGSLGAFEKESVNMDILDSIIASRENKHKASSQAIFLKNFPVEWNEKELQNLCCVYGEIAHVRIIVDAKGKSKGMAFVNYKESGSALKAVRNLNEITVKDRTLYAIQQGQKDYPPAKAAEEAEKQKKGQGFRGDKSARNSPKPKGPQVPPKSQEPTTIFVRNFNNNCTEEELRNIFGIFGKIKNCTIKTSDNNANHRFAFVDFEHADAVSRAIACSNNIMQAGNKLFVSAKTLNKPDTPKPQQQPHTQNQSNQQQQPRTSSASGGQNKQPESIDQRIVYMTNVPPYWNKEKVAHLASASGNVIDVVLTERDGYFVSAKIVYADAESSSRLFALHGFEVDGRALTISRKPPTPSPLVRTVPGVVNSISDSIRDMGIDRDFQQRPSSSQAVPDDRTAVMISNIPRLADLKILFEYFEQFGRIVETWPTNRNSARITFMGDTVFSRIQEAMPIEFFGNKLTIQRVYRY